MTVVLVHGNPETDAIWGPLVDALGRTDVVRLSPPGFGSPLPDDFPATYIAYRDWLETELEGIYEPVDLVGGAVAFIREDINPRTFVALYSRAGGEPTPNDWQ